MSAIFEQLRRNRRTVLSFAAVEQEAKQVELNGEQSFVENRNKRTMELCCQTGFYVLRMTSKLRPTSNNRRGGSHWLRVTVHRSWIFRSEEG